MRRVARKAFIDLLRRDRVRAAFQRWGYEPISKDPIDLRGLPASDLIEAWRRARGRPMIVEVAPEQCRILDFVGFSCAPGIPNPFVETAAGVLDGSVTDYESSPLRDYYQAFRPERVCDFWGWAPDVSSPQLRAPALEGAAPWDRAPGPHIVALREGYTRRDHAEFGASALEAEGWPDFGPVNDAKGRIEFGRIAAVTRSIRDWGYMNPNEILGNIQAQMMIDGEVAAIWITNGHHRVAALAALGHQPVPVLFRSPAVLPEDVENWPGVRSGAFTRAQALEVFDCVLKGRQSPWPGCSGWSRLEKPPHALRFDFRRRAPDH